MNFVTYFDPSRVWFCVLVATGAGTKPTSDGGPWAVEYTVPSEIRHRLADCSRWAEAMLWRTLEAEEPAVYARAAALRWPEATWDKEGGSAS